MQFDYDSIVNRLVASLQSKVSWASILEFSSNRKIIEAFAKEAAELMNYDNYLTRENQWALAKNSSSLLTNSDILSYRVHRKKGSTGLVKVSTSSSFNSGYSKTVLFPKYTVFSSSEDSTIKFCTTVNDSLPIDTESKELEVVQGTPKSYTVTANGATYEEIYVANPSIDNSAYEVYVNGVKWTETDNLLNNDPTDQVFEIKNSFGFSGIRIIFGNGVFGMKLNNGDSVVFYYVETLGSLGNVSKFNSITNVDSSIYDDEGTLVRIYCTNDSSMDGGDEVQDIESIRLNAPKLFQTGQRAVTKNDYKIILENSGFVYKVNVWGEYEYLIDHNLMPGDSYAFVPLEENKVNIAGIKNTGLILDDTDKSNIIAYLADYKSPTDIISFSDPEIVYLHFISNVYIKDRSYSLTTVKTNVTNTINNKYSFINFDFGTDIYETDYKTEIDNVEGVDHNYTIVKLFNLVKFNQANSVSFTASLYPIVPSTGSSDNIFVYLKDLNNPLSEFILIGKDDGAGNITGVTTDGVTYDLTTSYITYSNGNCYISINSPSSGYGDGYLNFQIKLLYTIESSDFILTSRNQIFRIGQADINCFYMQ